MAFDDKKRRYVQRLADARSVRLTSVLLVQCPELVRAGIHSTIGASIGLGVGLFLSFRLRRAGAAIYNAAKQAEKPTALVFADGRQGAFCPASVYVTRADMAISVLAASHSHEL